MTAKKDFESAFNEYQGSCQQLLISSRNFTQVEMEMDGLLANRYLSYYETFYILQEEASRLGLDLSEYIAEPFHNLFQDNDFIFKNITRIEQGKIVQFQTNKQTYQIPEKYLNEHGRELLSSDYVRVKRMVESHSKI